MSIEFDADSDYASNTSGTTINTRSPWTATLWVKMLATPGALRRLFAIRDSDYTDADAIAFNGDLVPQIEVNDRATVASSSAGAIASSAWVFMSIVRRSSTLLELYVDGTGTPVATITTDVGSVAPASPQHYLNAWEAFAQNPNARLAHVRLWQSALSTTQLAAEKASATFVTASPVAVYAFASTPTLYTDSAGSLTLTAGGTPIYSTDEPTFGPTSTATPALGRYRRVAPAR